MEDDPLATLAELASTDPVAESLDLNPDSPPGNWPVRTVRSLERAMVKGALVERLKIATFGGELAVESLLNFVYQPRSQPLEPTFNENFLLLDLANSKVLPSALRSLRGRHPGIFIEDLVARPHDFIDTNRSIATLDLSGNSFADEDLPNVLKLVQLCQPSIVKLRSNRFGYGRCNPMIVAWLRKTVELPCVVFVDIVGEMFTGVDWAPAYEDWPATLWTKLVFIRLQWLEGHDWKLVHICPSNFTALAQETHRLYFLHKSANPMFTLLRLQEVLLLATPEWRAASNATAIASLQGLI
ncbi:hypothetical protein CAOG_05516 [Capsaspora owczarzaki ATCC 30864]|uniref:Uncharacterized protein n=1 Tax=Capsaspora owczarzaki (strain ATCC 30864) TaxID=595528 RepID=A0A0D2WS95_CAPO3|nr:hypothetical protein CAOG_05516 [Capsaspora owczarzaki ATCC 30864]KJE94980.1 hypothetical protein CAOG_005516 [Capsaspora owczarzaki ATCC 30864]|eukprot:XP_004346189.1 hypothetical protein CAOG_05516 [Capsaspora owczarzaki ATCC 30864]